MDEALFIRKGCLTIVASGLNDLSGEMAEIFISTKRGERSRLHVTAIVVGETVIEDSTRARKRTRNRARNRIRA